MPPLFVALTHSMDGILIRISITYLDEKYRRICNNLIQGQIEIRDRKKCRKSKIWHKYDLHK